MTTDCDDAAVVGRVANPAEYEAVESLAMRVPRARTSHPEGAHALHSIPGMPRKQRFKPSRKPQQNQATVSSPQVDDRKEIHPDDSSIERGAPAREGMQDIERDGR